MDISSKILSDVIVFNKYAKYVKELKRRETFEEIVDRNLKMHMKKFKGNVELIKEINEAYKMVYSKKVLPSLRAMQFSGKPIELTPNRLFNCAAIAMDDVAAFSEILFLLLGGSGVGFSVQRHHIEKLPCIKKTTKTKRYVISDSIEGWADSVKMLVRSYFYGKPMPRFDFSDIRQKGAALVTSGGKAPGPQPLKDCLHHIQAIFETKKEGEQLSSLEVHDIVCVIADAVLAGGIRRSATISLFDLDDEDMLTSKYGNWWELNPQRGRANNSAIVLRHKVKEEDFKKLWKKIEMSGSGEPGFIFSNDKETLFNPCCFTGEMPLFTESGNVPLKDLVGCDFKAYNSSFQLIDCKVWSNGIKPTVKLVLCDRKIECTEDHLFQAEEGEFQAKDLKGKHLLNRHGFLDEVLDIEKGEEKEVFDFSLDSDNHWGFVSDVVSHNCEISLKSAQFCVAGDTSLITKSGVVKIKDVVGTEIEVWNGERWSKVTPVITGENRKLLRVSFDDGSFLDCTENHNFSVADRFNKKYSKVSASELEKFSKYKIHTEPFKIKNEIDGEGVQNPYTLGFAVGDGSVYKNSVIIDLYGEKIKCPVLGTRGRVEAKKGYNVDCVRVYSTKNVDIDLVRSIKHDIDGIDSCFSWKREDVLNFVAGWIDADGSRVVSGGVRLYLSHEERARKVQLLLTKNGIKSSVNLMSKKGFVTNKGSRMSDIYYLQITDCSDIPCHRVDTKNGHSPRFKGKNQTIASVQELEGVHTTYCFEEKEFHKAVFNNTLTYQCNLSEADISNVTTQEELNERVRAAATIGTIQAGYTDFHYLRDIWKKNSEKDALIGVSLTGVASGTFKDLDLKEAANIVNEQNEKIAKLMGINKASRTTCLKPSGTASLLFGCSSGIHAYHDEYYIRRVRLGKDEALYTYLKANHPDLIVDDVMNPKLGILEIPVKAPEGAITRNESPIELLERIKHFTENWVKKGYRKGENHNNVSATVSIKDHEWEEVGNWMWENRNSYNGLSVIPFFGGSYPQLPFESTTKEEYERRLKDLVLIDLSKVVEENDNTDLRGEAACSGGGCDVT